MNWIERLYEIQKLGRKDLYSQNGEGLYLEYIFESVLYARNLDGIDIGGMDGFYLSNTKHLVNLGWTIHSFDKEFGEFETTSCKLFFAPLNIIRENHEPFNHTFS